MACLNQKAFEGQKPLAVVEQHPEAVPGNVCDLNGRSGGERPPQRRQRAVTGSLIRERAGPRRSLTRRLIGRVLGSVG